MRKALRFATITVAVAVAGACNTAPKSTETAQPPASTAQQSHPVDDALITSSVQAKFFVSPDVKGRNIDVDTANGVVTLRGKVDTEDAHRAALDLARSVNGVTKVDDQLAVSTEADRMTARASQPETRSPAWITTKIQAQYYAHPSLKPWNIDVTTDRSGNVSLSGLVDNAAARTEAITIARATEGVTNVDDHLRIKGETAATTGTKGDITDSWITAKIQSRYFMDDAVKGRNIDVDTKQGVVTLRGTVNSYGERLAAASIARSTDGVREVQDELTIAPAKSDSSKVRDTVGTAGQAIEDSWITMKIQSKYFMDDQIKSRDINVDTKSGVVTLNGTVATADARKAAEELAKETDGVTRVNNRLRIEPSK